jgi:hypothetical protein
LSGLVGVRECGCGMWRRKMLVGVEFRLAVQSGRVQTPGRLRYKMIEDRFQWEASCHSVLSFAGIPISIASDLGSASSN